MKNEGIKNEGMKSRLVVWSSSGTVVKNGVETAVVERSRTDKGELELWYQKNLSAYTDLMLVFLTAWAIVAPKNNLVYSVFKDLPERPEELRRHD